MREHCFVGLRLKAGQSAQIFFVSKPYVASSNTHLTGSPWRGLHTTWSTCLSMPPRDVCGFDPISSFMASSLDLFWGNRWWELRESV